MTDSKIMIGDRVMISYPSSDGFNNPAKKLDGQEFTVKSVHRVTHRNQRTGLKYYELYDAVSEYGVNYAFLDDELIKI